MNEMLEHAFKLFDQANAEDPNQVDDSGEQRPKELVFAERLTEAVQELDENVSQPLLLASRCQHIRRWEVPRSTQPMGRPGYLKWRAGLKKFHAEASAEILKEVGYSEAIIDKVRDLNQKKNLKTDADCQTLEDGLCMVFLRYQFDDLIHGTEHDKMINIVRKTWAKMSALGHAKALEVNYSPVGKAIIDEALA